MLVITICSNYTHTHTHTHTQRKQNEAGCPQPMPAILATWQTEIRKTEVRGQTKQIVPETPISRK
jgi:hypothetical protein